MLNAAPQSFAVAADAPVGKLDALALSVGSRLTMSTLIVASVITIAIGASALLSSLRSMSADLKIMHAQLDIAAEGTEVLNSRMDLVPKMAGQMEMVVGTVGQTQKQVKASRNSVEKMAQSSHRLRGRVDKVSSDTASMKKNIESVSAQTDPLAATVNKLDRKLDPLVAGQHSLIPLVNQSADYICAMNGSLGYVLRILNYLTAPPSGIPFTARVEMDESTLPKIPGLKLEKDPVKVFDRGSWPIYNEQGSTGVVC
jgi:archaellum component FlaC